LLIHYSLFADFPSGGLHDIKLVWQTHHRGRSGHHRSWVCPWHRRSGLFVAGIAAARFCPELLGDDMTEAIATAVAAAAVFGGAVLAYRELSEVGSSRHMAVADRLFEELNSKESVAARRWIFQNLPPDPGAGLEALSPEGRDAIKHVLNSFDRVAFLTQTGWIPDGLVMPWMNLMVVKTWVKLGPYVEYESRRRNEPDYYLQVCRLAERCTAWRAERLPDSRITWIENAL
jgi:hypothetical protein